MKTYAYSLLLILILVSLLLPGCATVLGGRTNTLIFKSERSNKAEIYLDGDHIGSAPGKIKLEKTTIQHGSKLEIRPEGMPNQEYLILRKQNVYYTLANALTGGIWLSIDYATGNIFRPQPRVFNYDLNANLK